MAKILSGALKSENFFKNLKVDQFPKNPINGQVYYVDHPNISGKEDLPYIYSKKDDAWYLINSAGGGFEDIFSALQNPNHNISSKSVCVEDLFRHPNFNKVFNLAVNFQTQNNVGVCATASAVHCMLVDMAANIVQNPNFKTFYYPWLSAIYGAARVNIVNKKRLTPQQKRDGSSSLNALISSYIFGIPRINMSIAPRMTDASLMRLWGNDGTPTNVFSGNNLFVKTIFVINNLKDVIAAINQNLCVTMTFPFSFSGNKKQSLGIIDNSLIFKDMFKNDISHEMNFIGYTTNVPNKKLYFAIRDHNIAQDLTSHPDFKVGRPAGFGLISESRLVEVMNNKKFVAYACKVGF